MPQGVPFLCGADRHQRRERRVVQPEDLVDRQGPRRDDKVAIAAGHTSPTTSCDAKLDCIEVEGTWPSGPPRHPAEGRHAHGAGGRALEVGTPPTPMARRRARAEIVIADQPIEPRDGPGQFGTGIIGLGKMHDARRVKTPTFVRLRREPLAGQTTLEAGAAGRRAGSRATSSSFPTRGSFARASAGARLHVAGREVADRVHLRRRSRWRRRSSYNHKGARNADGTLEFLPHVGNLTRNVIVRSENPAGTRGHTMFISHADVDLRYAAFKELGRTQDGRARQHRVRQRRAGGEDRTNQIGRYAVHFHHNFGPKTDAGERLPVHADRQRRRRRAEMGHHGP